MRDNNPQLYQNQEQLRLVPSPDVQSREVLDYIRTGDEEILKRIIFRLFIKSPCKGMFKQEMASAMLYLMANDPNVELNISNSE